MEEEKNGITFKDIFRTILSQKWLALMVAVVVAIVCVFVMYFGYGPSNAKYVSSFTINMEVDENGKTCYPDGHTFNFRQLVSENSLKAVKESSGTFKDIDLNGLGLSLEEKVPTDGTNNASVVYTLHVNASSFRTKKIASDFVKAVTNTAEYEVRTWIDKYGEGIAANYNSVSGYERKLEYLSSTLTEIKNKFQKMKGDLTAEIAAVGNLQYSADLLKNELYSNVYESDVDALKSAVFYLGELNAELNQVNEVLANLISMGADGAAGTTIVINGADVIASYSERKIILTEKIKYYEDVLADYKSGNSYNIPETVEKKDGEEAFAGKLEGLLNSESKLVKDVFTYEYLEKSSVVVFVGEVVSKEGSTGLLTSLVIGVVAGVIVAAVVAYIVGWHKLKKQNSVQAVAVAEGNTEQTAEDKEHCEESVEKKPADEVAANEEKTQGKHKNK